MHDTVSDFLIRLKNAYLARHKTVEVSYARILESIGNVLKEEKFIKALKVKTQGKKKTIEVELSYPNRKPALTGIKRVSKPGLRVYVRGSRIPRVLGGLGLVILSTPKGIMHGREATAKNVGGELICKVW